MRGRSRTTTTKAPPAEDAPADEASTSDEGKAAPAAAPAAAAEPSRPSRFNLHRAGGNRLLPRGKLGRAGVSTEAPKEAAEDSAADSTHHNDVKGSETEAGEAGGEKTEEGDAPANHAGPVSGINRLKNRPRLNALHKTDAAKPKPAAATAPAAGAAAGGAAAPAAGRKVNPLLAKRRLHLGGAAAATSTTGECRLLPHVPTSCLISPTLAPSPPLTEAPAEEEQHSDASGEQAKEEAASAAVAADGESGDKELETTEAAEATTKPQARGLGLLGQRRRLPLRKPGTIL